MQKANLINQGKIIPVNYDLSLKVEFNEPWIYEGNVKIQLNSLNQKSIKNFDLHCEELEIIETNPISSFVYNKEQKTVSFKFDNEISFDESFLFEVKFKGTHNNNMCGFYRSYINNDIILSTQFEAIDARRCFPCIDEPNMKATFNSTLIVPSNMTALSNTSISSEEIIDSSFKKIIFEQTPRMSTYLLAFAVGNFQFIEGQTNSGVKIKVYTHNTYEGKAKKAQFALETAIKCIDNYNELFGVEYPLNKLDMIAIPEFAAGAMENWGLVTYREIELLLENDSPASHKERICIIVAHELAHQWFGNLVTMKWWNDLWLNEGFASWMEEFMTHKIHPEFFSLKKFDLTDTYETAIKLDSLNNSHPINVEIINAEEVEEVFDAISYNKGSCIINMIYNFIGEKNFFQGLKNYIKKYQYNNTSSSDLWNEWTIVSKMPINLIIENWINQKGFPLLTIESLSENTIVVSQQPFTKTDDNKNNIWFIPLKFGDNFYMMNNKSSFFTYSSKEDLNYLINYNLPLRIDFKEFINDFSNNIFVLNNYFSLFKKNLVNYSVFKEILKNNIHLFFEESNKKNITCLFDILLFIKSLEIDQHLSDFIYELTKNYINDDLFIEKTDEQNHINNLYQNILLNIVSEFYSEKYYDNFLKMFNDYLYRSKPLINKIPVIKAVLKNSTHNEQEIFDKLINVIETSNDPKEKVSIYNSIGYFSSTQILTKVLDYATNKIPIQDFVYVFNSASSQSKEFVFNYFKNNYKIIMNKINDTSFSIKSKLIIATCGSFTTESKLKEVQDFLSTPDMKEYLNNNMRSVNQMYENIQSKIDIKNFNQN